MELNPCDLCVPDARRLASERDHPPTRGGRAHPHLDRQAGDRPAAVRQRIRAVMDRAAALGLIDYNPAGDVINAALAKQPRVKNHHRALPYERLPAALRAVRASTANPSVKLAFEMLALTACRSGEVRGMTWDEVDLREATWTIPEARMKAGRPHRVPLSRGALAILEEARSLGDSKGVVFPAPHTGAVLSDMAFTQLLRRLELDFVPHGLRSSFRDWAAEQTDARHDVVESALAHAVGNATEAAYFRSDLLELRRRLMEEWGRVPRERCQLMRRINLERFLFEAGMGLPQQAQVDLGKLGELRLRGTAAELFDVDSSSGQLLTKAALN